MERLVQKPRDSIAAHLGTPSRAWWKLPLPGFALTSLPFSYGVFWEGYPDLNPILLLLLGSAAAALVWSWVHAFIFGGAVHLASQMLGGKRGLKQTVRAVDFALIWPGSLIALGGVLLAFLTSNENQPLPSHEAFGVTIATLALLLLLGGAVWAFRTVTVALEVRHGFRLWRSLAACIVAIPLLLSISITLGLGLLALLAGALALGVVITLW